MKIHKIPCDSEFRAFARIITCNNTLIAESETRSIVVYNIDTEQNANLENEGDLLSENVLRQENPMRPNNSPLSEGAIMLIERSTHLLGSVNTQPGDYAGREIDTEIDNFNKVVSQLMSQNSVSPIDDPFGYLWLANCTLYSTVAAFLLLKGWKKTENPRGAKEKWQR